METPFFTPSQRIQLSMDDLRTGSRSTSFDESVHSVHSTQSLGSATPSTPSGPAPPVTPIAPTIRSITTPLSIFSPHPASVAVSSANKLDYKKELAKLLVRSQGTPYEKTLKRFVESKLNEMDEDAQQLASERKLIQPDAEERVSLAALSKSKYDQTPPKAYSPFVETNETYWKDRIEGMSRPLDRNRYRQPEDYKVSTNHIGRQRPSPAEKGHAKRSHSKSQREIAEWLEGNQSWAAKAHSKVTQAQHATVDMFTSQAKPKIYAKSVKLAELAQMKEANKLVQSLHQSQRAASASPHPATAAADLYSTTSEPVKLDVYDRLSIRGRVFAEKRMHWTPPAVDASFSPAISERSVELAKRMRARQQAEQAQAGLLPARGLVRSHSASSLRGESPNKFLSRDSMSVTSLSVSKPSGDRRRHSGLSTQSLGAQSLRSVHSMHSVQSAAKSVDLSFGYEEDKVPQKVRQQLERTRSKSQTRAKESDKQRALREYVIVDAVPKPFQPTIVAKETHKIMSKVKSTFEERNLRSIENQLLRQVVAIRSPSPGPGHYSYSPRVASPPPGLKHYNTISHVASPGHKGYSFGKHKLESGFREVMPANTTYVIEYHQGQHANSGRVSPKPIRTPRHSGLTVSP